MPSPTAVPVFIAYSDVPAARDALARVTKLVRGRNSSHVVQPMLWRFDQLGQPQWSETAVTDALNASSVVVALGEESVLNAAAEAWLTALAARRRGAAINVLVFANDESWWISLERTGVVQPVATTAAVSARRQKKPATFVTLPAKNVAARAA